MANHFSHASLPYPVKNARFTILTPFLDADGDPTDPTTPDTEASGDAGAFADCTEEVTTITGSNGMGYITLTATEMNFSMVGLAFKVASGPKNTLATLYPRVLPIIFAGTASAGAAGSITLATDIPAILDLLLGCIVRTTGGTGGGGANNQARVITGFTTGRVAAVTPNWETTPDGTTTYDVLLTEGALLRLADVIAFNRVAGTFAGGRPEVNATHLLGTAWATPATAGLPDVNTKQISGDGTAADNAESFFDGTGYAGTGNTIPTVTTTTTATNVTTVNGLAANVITAASIAADAITAAKIADGAIDAATLATGTITATKFAAGAIDAAAIADGAIDAATFAAGAINAAAIAADAITDAKVASDVTIASVTGAVGSVTGAVGSVTAAVTVGTINANVITASALATDAATEIRSVASGTADSGSTTTIVDTERTEADTDYWKDMWVRFTSGNIVGQCRLITGFNAATDTITFTPATTQAVTTQTYEILAAAYVGGVQGNVSGSVGSVTGAVGSVTGNVGGNVVGTVASVVGNVAGNVTGSVGSVVGHTPQTGDNFARIGANGAGLTLVPWNPAWDAEVQSEVDDALVVHRLDELLNADSDIDGATAPTVGSVFHELLTKTAGSFTYDQATDSMEAIRDRGDAAWITGAGGDPWATALPGAYGAGTAGKIVGDNVDALISSRATPAQVNTEADTALTDYGALKPTVAGRTLDVTATGEAGVDLDNTAGALAKGTDITGFNDISAAQVNTEVDTAIADARLDELLATDSDIDGAAPPTVGSVFHELMSKTAGSFTFDQATDSLEAVRDNMGTAQTGDAYAIVNSGTHGNAALKTLVDAKASQTSVDTVDTVVDAIKVKTDTIPASPAAVGDIPTAAQNADAVHDEAGVELSVGQPSATPTFRQAWMLGHMARRNKQVTDKGVSPNKTKLYNDAGTVICQADVGDDGNVFTKEKLVTG